MSGCFLGEAAMSFFDDVVSARGFKPEMFGFLVTGVDFTHNTNGPTRVAIVLQGTDDAYLTFDSDDTRGLFVLTAPKTGEKIKTLGEYILPDGCLGVFNESAY